MVVNQCKCTDRLHSLDRVINEDKASLFPLLQHNQLFSQSGASSLQRFPKQLWEQLNKVHAFSSVSCSDSRVKKQRAKRKLICVILIQRRQFEFHSHALRAAHPSSHTQTYTQIENRSHVCVGHTPTEHRMMDYRMFLFIYSLPGRGTQATTSCTPPMYGEYVQSPVK